MLNIMAAGELHYWNVLRQDIQDNNRGDLHTVWLYMAHLNMLCQERLVSFHDLMSSLHTVPVEGGHYDNFSFLNAYSYRNSRHKQRKDGQKLCRNFP